MARPSQGPVPIPCLLVLECAVDRDMILVEASGTTIQCHLMPRPTPERPRPGRAKGDGIPETPYGTVRALHARRLLSAGSRDALDRSLGIEPGQVASAADPEAWARRSPLAWYERPYDVSDLGREVLEAGRERLAEWRRAEAEKALGPAEYVAVGRGRLGGVGALCRVLSRTPRRLKVEVVETGGIDGARVVLSETARGCHVSVDDVVVDGVDPGDWRRLAEATKDRDARLARDSRRFEERVRAIREEQAAAKAQAEAEYRDAVGEVLGNVGPRP